MEISHSSQILPHSLKIPLQGVRSSRDTHRADPWPTIIIITIIITFFMAPPVCEQRAQRTAPGSWPFWHRWQNLGSQAVYPFIRHTISHYWRNATVSGTKLLPDLDVVRLCRYWSKAFVCSTSQVVSVLMRSAIAHQGMDSCGTSMLPWHHGCTPTPHCSQKMIGLSS
jgi:hypothetical protein